MTDAANLLSTIKQWLKTQQLQEGARLPPERDLAEVFCVKRAELRKALDVLENEGIIRRHVGRGTFITANMANVGPDTNIAARTSPLAAMQARQVIEPELARLAALNATPLQIEEMQKLAAEMRLAESWDSYADLDWRLHNLIAQATSNILLIEVQRLLNDVRRYVVWSNLNKEQKRPPSSYHSFAEHEKIIQAISMRDCNGAKQAMLDHLSGTLEHIAN